MTCEKKANCTYARTQRNTTKRAKKAGTRKAEDDAPTAAELGSSKLTRYVNDCLSNSSLVYI